ncbi:MAG: hypothetical protein ACNI26_09450 [Terasakiella sp.]
MREHAMNEKPNLPSKTKVALLLVAIALAAYIGVYVRVYFFGP